MPTLQAVIRADGGKGEFDTVTLDTAAYEALYNKRADFVITFSAWEGVEAAQRGIALRTFKFTDYGFPDFYQVVLACDADWLAANPAAARAFVGATVRGFELAAASPDEASAILVAQNPGIFDANPELPAASARFMAEQGLLVDAGGRVGVQTLDAVDRLLLVPVRAGAPGRRRGQAAGGPAGLCGPVHERLPALRSAARDVLKDRLPPLALVLAILVAWEAYVRLAGVEPVVLPGPLRILESLWTFRDDALRHAVPTFVETVLGFALAVVLAIAAAAAMDRAKIVRRAVEPLFVTSQTIPVVALAPLFLLWFGFGLAPKVLVVVLVTFFPIVVALLDGFRSTSLEAEDLLRSYGATDGQVVPQAPLAGGAAVLLHRACGSRWCTR